MAIMNCWLKCSDDEKNGRRLSTKSTDFKYIQQIQKLLEKQQEFEEKRNNGQVFVKNEVSNDRFNDDFLCPPSPRPSSRASSPGRPRSRTSTNPQTQEKLARLKLELEQYKIDHSIHIRPPVDDAVLATRRRTWGGLQDEESSEEEAVYDDVEGVAAPERSKSPKFVPIQLPPNVSDAAVQTSATLERKFPENKKIFMTSFETTV
uniref:Uncharacterized protein n=1 Tax=Panagrolaimus sp. JU765 TaxID=591449 RepID=A0AC34QBR7_9BILA